MPNLLENLKERIVVFDGAIGTNLQVQNLSLDDFGGPRFEGCNENLLVTRPDAVEKVHAGFLDVGCDIVETNSFNGTAVGGRLDGPRPQTADSRPHFIQRPPRCLQCPGAWTARWRSRSTDRRDLP